MELSDQLLSIKAEIEAIVTPQAKTLTQLFYSIFLCPSESIILFEDDKSSLIYQGKRLGVAEAELIIVLLHHNARLILNKTELIKLLGWANAGPNIKKIEVVIQNLLSAELLIGQGTDFVHLPLLKAHPISNKIDLSLPAQTLTLLNKIHHPKMMNHLSNKTIAKALYLLIESLPGASQSMSIHNIKSLLCLDSPERKIISSLEKSMTELKDLGLIDTFKIRKEFSQWLCDWIRAER
jgi:hypothetical protein